MHVANVRVSSESSDASLTLGNLVKIARRSSSASLRSFHFEDLRLVWNDAGNLDTISSARQIQEGQERPYL